MLHIKNKDGYRFLQRFCKLQNHRKKICDLSMIQVKAIEESDSFYGGLSLILWILYFYVFLNQFTHAVQVLTFKLVHRAAVL